jgi:hypothetical protein
VLNWSYARLSGEEQLLLSRLSVFTGGFFTAAAEEVCGTLPTDQQPLEVAFTLDELRPQEPARVSPDSHRAGRCAFWMLEVIRAFCVARAASAGEVGSAVDLSLRQKHGEYFLRLAKDLCAVLHRDRTAGKLMELDLPISVRGWTAQPAWGGRISPPSWR